MSINAELLKILVCPQCKGDLDCTEEGLACRICGLLYPVKNDIPIMLIDEALPLPKS